MPLIEGHFIFLVLSKPAIMKFVWKYLFFFLIGTFATNTLTAQSTITSIAGNGITQYIGDGSPATNYSLAHPLGVFVDKTGNIYVADDFNQRIRKIAHDTLSTIAGTGVPGYSGDGGLADTALLRQPDGIYLDTAGNMYITEKYNDVVRKVDANTGIITTICGTGSGGYAGDGGPATAAHMETPGGACVDIAGNIYIPDYDNQRIRKVNASTGVITTIAGTGVNGYSGDGSQATNAKLSYPNSICTDNTGNIFFSEFGNSTIRKIDAITGVITTTAGTALQGYTGDGGPATAAKLNQPNSVFIDSHGYIYISDYGNNVVRVITNTGIISTIAGSGGYGYAGDGGPATNATFNGPTAVFVDDSGYIFIADGGNSAIRKITPLPVITGIANITETALNIFPNPSSGKFTIVEEQQIKDANIEIFNAVGQSVYKALFTGREMNIDLSGRSTGMYFIQFTSSACIMTRKIIIVK
jgi:sugar lactone lactonase YvrE